jgi:uncharacterized protein
MKKEKLIMLRINKYPSFLLLWSFCILYIIQCSSLSPIQTAAKENDVLRLKELISSGVSVDKQDECVTPLITASYSNNYEAVKFLLENKANPNLRTKECELFYPYHREKRSGYTALQEVTDLKIAKILVEYGANPNLAGYIKYNRRDLDDYPYNAPLKFALDNMNLDLIEFFMKQNVNLKNYDIKGKNVYKKKLEFFKLGNPEFYNSAIRFFNGKDISDLNINSKLIADTEKISMDTYTNIFTNKQTTLPTEITKKLKENKKYFAPVTYDSAQADYFHYSEFTWNENNQNLWEWYILRNLKQ